MTETACRKHRINQVFHPADAACLREALEEEVHPYVSEATLLLKFVLTQRALQRPPGTPIDIDEDAVWSAVRAVRNAPGDVSCRRNLADNDGAAAGADVRRTEQLGWQRAYRSMLGLPEGDVDACAEVYRTAKNNKKEIARRLAQLNVRLPDLQTRPERHSVSGIVGLAARQYVASTLTNIRQRFGDCVRKSAGVLFRSKACTLEGVRRFEDLATNVRRRWGRAFGIAYDDLLNHREGASSLCDTRLKGVMERHRRRLVPAPVIFRRRDGTLGPLSVDLDLDKTERCFVYLGYMLRLAEFMERVDATVPSPLPIKKSFIPAHYSIDTGSICQLLFKDAGRISKFKRYFEHSVSGGFALPGLTTKGHLCSKLAVQSGRPDVTAHDEATFKDALWTYLGMFRNRRTRALCPVFRVGRRRSAAGGSKLFDHSISTDGYSVSLLVTDNSVRGRKTFKSVSKNRKRAPRKTAEERAAPAYTDAEGFPLLNSQTAANVARTLIKPSTVLTGGDPGKNVLLMLIDVAFNRLRYTAAQRRHDTLGRLRSDATTRVRFRRHRDMGMLLGDGVMAAPSAAYVENTILRRHTSRAATPTGIAGYARSREAVRKVMERTYNTAVFRWARFLAWTRKRGSVEGFAKRIRETYGNDVAVAYGDWGRRPNLKNQAPSPGIGLRRVLHFLGILTITVRENYTSSFCCACESEVTEGRGVHGLLHCAACETFWTRDVLGAANILKKALFILDERTPHPVFGD